MRLKPVKAALFLTLGVVFSLASPVLAGEHEAGKAKSRACVSCHGAQGIGTLPIFPNLAGQQGEYLMIQLRAFRDGSRKNENMNVVAKSLSDEDIADLAAYYASLK